MTWSPLFHSPYVSLEVGDDGGGMWTVDNEGKVDKEEKGLRW